MWDNCHNLYNHNFLYVNLNAFSKVTVRQNLINNKTNSKKGIYFMPVYNIVAQQVPNKYAHPS